MEILKVENLTKVVDGRTILDKVSFTILKGDKITFLAQDDMVALRVVMRLGWEIPNPVNALDETEARFPFASLKPATV